MMKKESLMLLAVCFLLAAAVCVGHISGSGALLMFVLVAFVLLIAAESWRGRALPLLFFFLPWSTLLKLDNTGHSAFSIALLTLCSMLFLKQGGRMNKQCLLSAFLILDVSLCSRLLQGESLSLPYLMLLLLFFFMPQGMEECKKQDCFGEQLLFFFCGIVSSALSAKYLAEISGISSFINVYRWDGIVRFSGYYGDANFYAAHITAALAGVLLMMAEEKRKLPLLFYAAGAVLLLYCGLLSASKSFALTVLALLFLWLCLLLWKRRWKLLLLTISGGFLLLCAALYLGGLDILLRRFHESGSMSQLTTGRLDLWLNYINTLLQDAKLCFLGIGLENIKLDGRSSHSTVLQIVYQLGLMGTAALILWEWAFLKESLKKLWNHLPQALLLACGIFMPWLALDLLFFDEFFLLQLYFAAGLTYVEGVKA